MNPEIFSKSLKEVKGLAQLLLFEFNAFKNSVTKNPFKYSCSPLLLPLPSSYSPSKVLISLSSLGVTRCLQAKSSTLIRSQRTGYKSSRLCVRIGSFLIRTTAVSTSLGVCHLLSYFFHLILLILNQDRSGLQSRSSTCSTIRIRLSSSRTRTTSGT